MTLDVAFYGAVASLIPVFLLALVVDMGIEDLNTRRSREKVAAVMLWFIMNAVVVEALCLGVLALHEDVPVVAALTILGLGSTVSIFLVGVVFRIPRHRELLNTHTLVAALPLAIATIAGLAVLLTA